MTDGMHYRQSHQIGLGFPEFDTDFVPLVGLLTGQWKGSRVATNKLCGEANVITTDQMPIICSLF
jgi:hypothetical protein